MEFDKLGQAVAVLNIFQENTHSLESEISPATSFAIGSEDASKTLDSEPNRSLDRSQSHNCNDIEERMAHEMSARKEYFDAKQALPKITLET